jgi:hypothetical protein
MYVDVHRVRIPQAGRYGLRPKSRVLAHGQPLVTPDDLRRFLVVLVDYSRKRIKLVRSCNEKHAAFAKYRLRGKPIRRRFKERATAPNQSTHIRIAMKLQVHTRRPARRVIARVVFGFQK